MMTEIMNFLTVLFWLLAVADATLAGNGPSNLVATTVTTACEARCKPDRAGVDAFQLLLSHLANVALGVATFGGGGALVYSSANITAVSAHCDLGTAPWLCNRFPQTFKTKFVA
jgi:hypothetical protein